MPETANRTAFALVSRGMVLTAGPNMVYLVFGESAALAATAGSVAAFLGGRPAWMMAQRWLTGTMVAGFAVRMATEARR